MGAGDRPGIALVGWFCVRMTRGVLGAVFFFVWEWGVNMREGKSFISGREGMAGSWFFRDRAGFRTGIFLTRLRVKKHRMFIRCEIVQEQLLTSKLDGAVSARFRAVLNF